jgi:dTMP kinase
VKRGIFITFEGVEGSGKSTQIKRLVTRLEGAGHEVLTTREPGGTPTGEAIRNILQHDVAGEDICAESETLLFEASRAQLVRNVIQPALERGVVVISDRFADSTTAYQGYGRGFDVETLLKLHAFAMGGLEPNLTFLVDVGIAEGFRRIQQRSQQTGVALDRMERESQDFHQRVCDGYRAMSQRWPERFRVLDGERDADRVENDIWQDVVGLLNEC